MTKEDAQPGQARPLAHLTDTRSSLTAALRIVSLPTIGVSRARWLLSTAPPERVVEFVSRGKLPPEQPEPVMEIRKPMLDKWREGLAVQDVDALVARNLTAGMLLMDAGHGLWPFTLDPDPPVLLWVAGNPELLIHGRRVGVVGTRRCSAVGRSVAREIGWTLAEASVSVVSGLALGIDTAAHQGAGNARNRSGRIGVVASGLDVVYPPRNAGLWNQIATGGVLITETPMGERANRWRFPARNRLIAALSELVVVVESHQKGGALITVDEAASRGVEVVAVPGSVSSPACEGTNELLMDGAAPVRNGSDVLLAIGVDAFDGLDEGEPDDPDRSGGSTAFGQLPLAPDQTSHSLRTEVSRGSAREVEPGPLANNEQIVVDEVAGGAVHLDQLSATLEISIARLLGLTQRLHRAGHLKVDGSMVGPVLDRAVTDGGLQ